LDVRPRNSDTDWGDLHLYGLGNGAPEVHFLGTEGLILYQITTGDHGGHCSAHAVILPRQRVLVRQPGIAKAVFLLPTVDQSTL
jgi:hypothetical protein